MTIRDMHDRTISYLRLSVTDRCNLRCKYCVPQDAAAMPERLKLLSFDELTRIVRVSASLGIRKIRVTGGEPLVRPGIVPFLERINVIPGIGEVVLTTNGILLSQMAADLRQAGVKRLNISLDSLLPSRFEAITGGGSLKRVLAGIEAARSAGFPAPQINAVMLRGVNDHEINDFAALSAQTGMAVRFIEYMPVNGDAGWRASYLNSDEILGILSRKHHLIPEEHIEGAGPARYFRLEGTEGKIGVISPISKHFCANCNRLRVTAEGFARGCLFSSEGTDLRPFLQTGDFAVRQILSKIILEKPTSHNLSESLSTAGFVPMSAIGG
jgi:cyclic pyranopterin phosphate synthase